MGSGALPGDRVAPEEEWQGLLEACRGAPGVILALGGTDVGKTSLCRWLSHQLAGAGTVAIIDADLGQARIGPPAAVGLRSGGQGRSCFRFVGDTSPARCPTAALAALGRLARMAWREHPDWLIVDTTGWVSGTGAVDLKLAKIELLLPRHLLAVQRSDELEPILRAVSPGLGGLVHRLAPSPRVRARSAAVRAEWRRARFAHFLIGASPHWVPLAGKRLTHPPRPEDAQRGQLVCLEDDDGLGICIGLLQTIDSAGGRAQIICRPEGLRAGGVHFGSVTVELSGGGG